MVQVRLFIKTSLWLLIFVYAEAQEQQQDRQQQHSQKAEVHVNKVESVRKLKFGDKKPIAVSQAPIPTNFSNFRIKDDNVSSRRPGTEQRVERVTQYDIPIVHKKQSTNAAFTDPHKGQQPRTKASALPVLERSKYSTITKWPQPTMQFEKRVNVVTTPRNWSRNRGAELNATNTKVNAVEGKERKQYVPQRSSGLLFDRPISKKNTITPTTKTPTAAATKTKTTTTTKATTTTKTPSTTTKTARPGFLQNNPFNIFSPQFWGFSNPSSTTRPTTKKPPKKYTPTPTVRLTPSPRDEKLKLQKSKVEVKTTPPLPTTTVAKKESKPDGPFRIALPTLNFFNGESQNLKNPDKEKEKRAILASLRERFNCPRESEVRFQLFPKICKIDEDCSVWNRDELCCDIFGSKSCVSGVAKPLEESSHAPILGLIPRKCPSRPLAELWWEVKECETDTDCWPRVCCPDGKRRYCRTSQPELQTAPVQVKRSFDYLSEYLECTPPPPPIFDLHPKTCTSTFDCFPNVCCQEAGLRHCRPPKKSVLTLMANFLNVDVVRRFAQNIVIK